MRNLLGKPWKLASLVVGPLALGAAVLALALRGDVAQASPPPYDPAIDVQLFDQSPGNRSFMGVADGSTEGKDQYSVDFLLTFLTNPFVIYNVNQSQDAIVDTRTDVVASMLAGQLTGAYGLSEKLQLGVALPLVFSMRGDGLDPSTGNMAVGGLSATGLGDLRIEAKGRLLRSSSMGAAWVAGLSLPTSFGKGGNAYLGDDLPSLRGGVSAHMDLGDGALRLGGNAGIILRKPRKIYASEVGQQLTYGAGAALRVTDRFEVIGEVFGRTALTAIELDASPLEVGGGMRLKATQSISVLAGGGAGVVGGIGSPAMRFLLSVGYAPDLGDTDKDGIANMNDKCPLLPEDFDDFEDSDGCPDNDNDGDRRWDNVDQCPNDKEDIDGFEDEDGCPEYDNDKDGILDAKDRCPIDPEDGIAPYDKDGCPASKRDSDDDGISDLDDQCVDEYEDDDGFEDWDGCPEADNDHDGIPDEDDSCPLCPEDLDGFEDEDGCPDLDNDQDGIADASDTCPAKAETFNGVQDGDGCPDSGAPAAVLEGNRLLLAEPLRFSGQDALRNRQTLLPVAQIMHLRKEIKRWRVVVAAKTQASEAQTRAKGQARADAIRAALIAAGLDETTIEAVGAISARQVVAIAAIERGDADEDFVCPESLEVKPREKPLATQEASAPTTPPSAPTAKPAAEPAHASQGSSTK